MGVGQLSTRSPNACVQFLAIDDLTGRRVVGHESLVTVTGTGLFSKGNLGVKCPSGCRGVSADSVHKVAAIRVKQPALPGRLVTPVELSEFGMRLEECLLHDVGGVESPGEPPSKVPSCPCEEKGACGSDEFLPRLFVALLDPLESFTKDHVITRDSHWYPHDPVSHCLL